MSVEQQEASKNVRRGERRGRDGLELISPSLFFPPALVYHCFGVSISSSGGFNQGAGCGLRRCEHLGSSASQKKMQRERAHHRPFSFLLL